MHVTNVVFHQQSNSGVTVIASIVGTLVAVGSLLFVGMTYLRDERFSAVLSSESVTSFQKPIKLCETLRLTMFNHSKYTTSLQPTIYAENLSVHTLGNNHPAQAAYQLTYAGQTIKVGESYDTLFQAHIILGNPTPANLSVYVGYQRLATFWYAWDAGTRSYICTGWN
jgi:hypothetical protein